MTTATCSLLDPATGLLAPGRWILAAAASRLRIETTFRGLFALRGRFTEVAGRVDVADELGDCRMQVDVAAASLTTGSATRDAMLHAAGLIDPAVGPLLRFRSRRLVRRGAGLVVDGVIGTERGAAPVRLDVQLPRRTSGPVLALRARGVIDRETIGALLTRPGVERLLGATARLDLTIGLRPDPDLTHVRARSHTSERV